MDSMGKMLEEEAKRLQNIQIIRAPVVKSSDPKRSLFQRHKNHSTVLYLNKSL